MSSIFKVLVALILFFMHQLSASGTVHHPHHQRHDSFEPTCPLKGVPVPIDLNIAKPGLYNHLEAGLQIFPYLKISCDGLLTNWKFIPNGQNVYGLHLGVFRENRHQPSIFEEIGETYLNNVSLNAFEQDWATYTLNEPIAVRQGDMLGFYYDNIETPMEQLTIRNMDEKTLMKMQPLPQFPTSFVALLDARHGIPNHALDIGNFGFRDYRLPALTATVCNPMAFFGPNPHNHPHPLPTVTVPTTVPTTRTTRKKRCTRTPTTPIRHFETMWPRLPGGENHEPEQPFVDHEALDLLEGFNHGYHQRFQHHQHHHLHHLQQNQKQPQQQRQHPIVTKPQLLKPVFVEEPRVQEVPSRCLTNANVKKDCFYGGSIAFTYNDQMKTCVPMNTCYGYSPRADENCFSTMDSCNKECLGTGQQLSYRQPSRNPIPSFSFLQPMQPFAAFSNNFVPSNENSGKNKPQMQFSSFFNRIAGRILPFRNLFTF